MKKLQLALDDISLIKAVELLQELSEYVDIVEIGTPFMMEYGMESVRVIKEKFPEKEILCDTKIMDAGAFEAEIAFNAGADIITVLGVTDNLTIRDCVRVAKKFRKKIMVDFICVEDIEKRTKEVVDLGVDILAVHTGVDQQAVGRTPLDDLNEMSKYSGETSIAVAGGITSDVLSTYLSENPDIIIVGGGILNTTNPIQEAQKIAAKIKRGSI